ncbi:MAG: Hsp20/alpha crystallin family protein [Rubrivivax sp.]
MFLVPLSRSSSDFARSIDRFFEAAAADSSRSPALDVSETDTSYTVQLDLPGVSKQDVQVSIEGRRVSVQAQSKPSDDKKHGDRVVYRERSSASFSRKFTLPVEVDQAEANARLDNGVLTLTLPKRSARSASQIAVN